MDPTTAPERPLWGPTQRLVVLCLAAGLFGAAASLFFDAVVHLVQGWLLEGIGGYSPPAPGVLAPAVKVPGWPQRWWLPVVTTLGGLLSGFIVYRWAPEAEGHGTDAAIAAFHRGARVRARIPPIKALASALTIGSGGVAGREGPTAQISVGLTSILANLLGIRGQERRILILAGMAAGLAAMFRAPLGMAIFSVEILYSGMVFESEALIYTVIAAVTGYAVHGFFAGWEPIFEIPGGLAFNRPLELLGFAALGVLAGLLGSVLPAILYRTRDLFHRLPGPPHLRPAVGGLMVGLAGLAAPGILGTGYGWVELALAGQLSIGMLVLLLLAKGPAMAWTIGSGGSGGVFAPTITLGAMLGAVVGWCLNLIPGASFSVPAMVLVGMAAVFAAAARTPISTLIMVVEMTAGYGLIVPAMLTNVLAFLVQRGMTAGVRYPTLYESQVEDREDSPVHRGIFVRRAFKMVEGGELEGSDLTLPRLVSLLRFGEPIPVASGGAVLAAVEVAPGSSLDGSTVAESVGTVEGATAVAVLRAGEMVIPRGPTLLAGGDQLIVVVTAQAHARLEAAAAATGAAVELEEAAARAEA